MKKVVLTHLINFLVLIYFELVFKLLIFKTITFEASMNILLYIIFASILITILTNIFTPKINKVLLYVTYSIIPILYSIQLVFKNIFNAFFSFSLLGLSDQVLEFGKEAVGLILQNIVYIILFFIPLIILIIFRKKISSFKLRSLKSILIEFILLIVSLGSFYLYLNTEKGEYLSGYSLYYEVSENSLNIEKLGVLNAYKLDLVRTIFGFQEKIEVKELEDKEEIEEKEEEIIYQDNLEDLDLSRIKEKSSVVYNYINSNSGSKQNEYTGLFEGKNLVYIVAESFDEIAISEELTPTLYKLTNSSFMFENFYTPNYLSTIGGEFQALTALHPSQELLKSFRSGVDSFPYGLANIYKDLGYKTFAYHNNSGYFQDRNKYLKSFGFDNFKACYMGLEKLMNCKRWPASDVDMINVTIDDYLNSDTPFMAYYMTVSGHFEYTYEGNSIASKNQSLVSNLPYSESVKAYIATQIELDRALELLISKLEEAGKLDDTVIVLMADHYPYALSLKEINEASTYERDSVFEINHNKLIIYNSKVEPTKIEKVASSPDVLPTVYNLFGVKYDSRLFTGSDILSTNEGLAIFQNRSWISDKAIYNSSTNTYQSKGEEVDRSYIDNINNLVNSKLAFSKEIVMNNYYLDILGQ